VARSTGVAVKLAARRHSRNGFEVICIHHCFWQDSDSVCTTVLTVTLCKKKTARRAVFLLDCPQQTLSTRSFPPSNATSIFQKPTYVAFVDYSTAYPSVHIIRLSSILLHNSIVGHMWHHLRARIDNIRLGVLHPNIQEHQTVDILRGLPAGSRLSPTLFGIFVADLIHELQTKFNHAVINLAPGLQHNGTTQIWIGGLLYVDDLALMSTCPCELQAMLHVCQEWSIRNRMQINTQKTKVMAFFETPSLQKACGGQHRPGPTLPPFDIHAPLPTSSPCSHQKNTFQNI